MNDNKIKVAIIGAGYWGKNLIRVFYGINDVELVAVCDLDKKKLEKVEANYPTVRITQNVNEIINNPQIDAVLIATPTDSHYSLALSLLESGKHVWVEKPMTKKADEAKQLIEAATKLGLILHVDHTFLYTPAVRKIKQLVGKDELGKIRYLDSKRINLGLIQPDVNVIYDLAVHDIYIFNYILNAYPIAVSAIGLSCVTNQSSLPREEMAHINLIYPNNILAHVYSSWLSPVKMREMVIVGDKKTVVYNDIEPTEKIKIYDVRVDINLSEETPFEPIYRSGDILIPRLEDKEALQMEAEHFINCIKNKTQTLTDGVSGLETVKILEAADKSMKEHGKMINLAYESIN